jgi:RNA polymerase sigma-70 factor (ECF subfamily)
MAIDGTLPGRLARWVSSAEPDWDVVYAEQLPRVYNFFRYRFGHSADAEDLTSRTFEKAWQARHRYRKDVAAFSTWLLSIARNVAIDHARARRHHLPLEAAETAASAGTPEETASHRSDAERLAVLLALLPERERELIAMKFGAEMNNRAIARATGLTESNVGTILHRAIGTIRAQWAPAAAAGTASRGDES